MFDHCPRRGDVSLLSTSSYSSKAYTEGVLAIRREFVHGENGECKDRHRQQQSVRRDALGDKSGGTRDQVDEDNCPHVDDVAEAQRCRLDAGTSAVK